MSLDLDAIRARDTALRPDGAAVTAEVLSCPAQARVAGSPDAVLCSLPLGHGVRLELVPPPGRAVLHESGPVGPWHNVMWTTDERSE